MFTKKWSLVLFVACNVAAHASENPYQLAQIPYSKEEALRDLTAADYPVWCKDLVFKGNPSTGANFVDTIVPIINQVTGTFVDVRAVCYGPGRYVKTHSHDEDEFFVVTRGGCKVWALLAAQKGKLRWKSMIKQRGDIIEIHANTVHCLIAGPQGLCMHVGRNDSTRSVNFVEMQQPWEQDLESYDLNSLYPDKD